MRAKPRCSDAALKNCDAGQRIAARPRERGAPRRRCDLLRGERAGGHQEEIFRSQSMQAPRNAVGAALTPGADAVGIHQGIC